MEIEMLKYFSFIYLNMGFFDWLFGLGEHNHLIKEGWEEIVSQEEKLENIPKKIRQQVGEIRAKNRFNIPDEILLEDKNYFYSFRGWVNYGQAEEELQPTKVYRRKK
jgi:hypothetical protein